MTSECIYIESVQITILTCRILLFNLMAPQSLCWSKLVLKKDTILGTQGQGGCACIAKQWQRDDDKCVQLLYQYYCTNFNPVALQTAEIWTLKKIQNGCHGSKIAAIIPKLQPVIDMGVISLSSKFQPGSSSNG